MSTIIQNLLNTAMAVDFTLDQAAASGAAEAEVRAEISAHLANSVVAAAVEAAFTPLYAKAAPMTGAFKTARRQAVVRYRGEGVDLMASATLKRAVNLVAAAAVFAYVEEPLEPEIAKILGVSYEEGEWPGPRYEPTWAI